MIRVASAYLSADGHTINLTLDSDMGQSSTSLDLNHFPGLYSQLTAILAVQPEDMGRAKHNLH